MKTKVFTGQSRYIAQAPENADLALGRWLKKNKVNIVFVGTSYLKSQGEPYTYVIHVFYTEDS